MDTDRSFIFHIETFDIYKEIAEDVERRFDISDFELKKPLPKGKNKNIIRLMKNELGGQTRKEFVAFRAKTYSYFKDNSDEDKQAKGTKQCVIKRKLKFEDVNSKKLLKAAQIENKIIPLEKNKFDIEDHKEFIKNNKLILNQNKDLEVKCIMLLLKKLIRLL